MLSINKSVSNVPIVILVLFFILALVGFSDATYLAAKHFKGEEINCSLLNGCTKVTTSVYSTVAGIPISLFGSFYYLTFILGLVLYWDIRNGKILYWLSLFTVSGFIVSLILFGIQALILNAYCLYCIVSAIICTLLFILGMWILKYKDNGSN